MAMCLFKTQQFNNAEILIIEVEKMRKQVQGEKHSDKLNSKLRLARCLYKKHQFDNA